MSDDDPDLDDALADPEVDALTKRATSGASAARKERDRRLWENWRDNGKQPEHLEPLLDAFAPVFAQKMKEWKPPSIPTEAFHADLTRHAIDAFHSYDPNRGAALATHVINGLLKSHRFRERGQNLAYMSPEKSNQIGKIDRGADALTTTLGRPPNVEELADHLGMSVKALTGVQNARRRDIPGSTWESDPLAQTTAWDREVLDSLHEELSPEELQVFNHIYGRGGARQITETNALARALGKSAPQISRLRSSIRQKFDRFK